MSNTRLLACVCALAVCSAQDSQYAIQKAQIPVPLRSYAAPDVPAVKLSNSSRLHALLRAGKLYLTVQDTLRWPSRTISTSK